MISFNAIPADLRVPGVYAEIDASRAVSGLPAAVNKRLLIGQRLATGLRAALIPARIVSAAQGASLFGRGSMLDRMIRAALAADPLTELWAIAVDDLVAGTAATATITPTGPATAAGTIALMIAGQRVPVGIASGDAAAAVGTKIAAAVAALPDLPVTAAANGAGVVTLTARHKGTAGNAIDARVNHYQGELLPAGLALAIADFAGGAGDPDLVPALAALGDDESYRTIVIGQNNSAAIGAVEAELATRWGPTRMIDGTVYVGLRGTVGVALAFGAARNSAFSSIIAANRSPSPIWEWAASYGSAVGAASAIDPARPARTLPLPGILAPSMGYGYTAIEREQLLRDGISTFNTAPDGTVTIERAISTFQTDAFGIDSVAWLDLTTSHTVAYLRYSVRLRISQRYPRHKIADDGTQFGPGQAIITPKVAKAEFYALFREWEDAGLVENFEGFRDSLIVERDAADRGRLNVLMAPDIVNPFHVMAVRIEFRL